MFEDKEAYEEDWPHLTSIWRDDAEELIEALRAVARAAYFYCESSILIPGITSEVRREEIAKIDRDALERALDVLPGWILEEE